MSWSYSRGLVEEYLGQCFSDTGLSALLNTTHTPDLYYWPDKTTEHSRISRFGMTCELLMAIRGEELLTWSLAGFRAKTSALPETVPDWTAKGQGYGQKWLGLLAKYNHDTHSLKTAQLSLLEDSTECCPTLPRWGLMLDGELYPQPTPALRTEENDYGLLRIQTPTVEDAGRAGKVSNWLEWLDKRRTTQCRLRNQAAHMDQRDGILNPEWTEWLMGWPMGWTDLKPLATDKFQEFEQQHGSYFMDDKQCA